MAKVYHEPLPYVKTKCSIASYHSTVIFFILILACNAATAFYSICSINQFACTDGNCISLEKMCNGHVDCPDSSDEQDCDMKLCHKPNWFQCAEPRGPCLSSDLVCNGIDNCPGGEDEVDCSGSSKKNHKSSFGFFESPFDVYAADFYSVQRNCTEFEYTCQADKSCIPLDFICNGKRDCRDGSDEVDGCIKAEHNCAGFFCANKKCLEYKKWVCDGVDDCGDGSEEKHCVEFCNPQLDTYLCRNNATCLNLTQVCDGKSDCPDGSDESSFCTSTKNNCANKICPPAAKCIMDPTVGAECVCPKGYRHSLVQNVCVDINECFESFGICSHRCENTPGSYRCVCDDSYILLADNKTCKAYGNEDPLLLYTTQVTVMGVHLRSKRVFTVAKNLTKVIGVTYNGDHIYWTNIQNEAESIVRANKDGTAQDILLTSGLDAPEDLAVDWLTGNIYFSDNIMHHIAVCSNDGVNCVPLVKADIQNPRGIALWPQLGLMFWTDWGSKPMIARASMDGSKFRSIVTDNIHWPNGVAIDMHNNRVFWVDAKLAIIESVRPDGSDRRLVLDGILKHPYGIAVFEDNIYWSDWGTKSVHTCNKFTGKDHEVIIKDRTIYAVHVYHSAKQTRTKHACMNTRCSHLCLLSEGNSSTCACPEGMELSADQLRCEKTRKRQRLLIGIRNTLIEIEHTNFGRHKISKTHNLFVYISEMAYNSVNGSVFLVDNMQRAIYEFDIIGNRIETLVRGNLGNISGIAFDYLSHSIYWTDAERHVVEMLSLRTHQRAIIAFFSGMESPIAIAIMPEDGIMFVALQSRRQVHMDKISLDGRGERTHVFEDDLGDDDIKMTVDYDSTTLFWTDSDMGRISISDYRNVKAYTFRGRLRKPYSIAIVDDDIFWSQLKSPGIHWTHKNNLGPLKRIDVEPIKDAGLHLLPPRIPLASTTSAVLVDHPCQHNNGDCSHICVAIGKFAGACLCPAGLVFKDAANRTCIEALDCEFRCRSGECLTSSHRCNNRKDCPDGSDEEGCNEKQKVVCAADEFTCADSTQCIIHEKRCDDIKDCRDSSDELHCEHFDKMKYCHRHQHACDNGQCVDFSVMCDGTDDCGDNSDEHNCKDSKDKPSENRPKCGKDMFQCTTGTCIAKSWECDGKLDCTDGSDEHEKCELKDCPKDMHKCLLGQCIDLRLVCDGHNDCGDFSDEVNCDLLTGTKKKLECGDDIHIMYQCPSDSKICLEVTAQCNGTAECPRGEDEANCGAVCSILEFQCKSSKECIRKEFRCDHEKDCADGSDEFGCEHLHKNTTKHEHVCEAHMFDCKDGKCVDMNRVCDGFEDCETEADEGALCKTACIPTSSKPVCEHNCRPTPTGAVCSCFRGFKLDTDHRTCYDVNECDELNPCAQICENTHGSYRCSCFPDFMLRTDKTTCKSIESESALMFSSYNEVRSMSEQPIILRVAWSANDSKIMGFDVDVRKRMAYFTTNSEDVLYMVDMKSGRISAGLAVPMPTKVSVDWITDNVYVISRSGRYEIKICSFVVKMCGRLFEASSREVIKALTVDAFNHRLFYVIIKTATFGATSSEISISNLDSNKRETLLNKNGGFITALATDPYKKVLYFLDFHTKTLEAISYQLGSKRTPTIIIQKANAVMHPSGLTVYENQAFIVNIGAKEAARCHLFGSHECKAINLNILNAEDILVDGVSRQPLTTDPCAMAKCVGICLQAEYGYECMCGDAIVNEGVQCTQEQLNEIVSSALLARTNENEDSNGHSALIITLSILAIVFIAVGVGYWYYRRFKQGHRDFNINLHFQNPLSSFISSKSSAFGGGAGTRSTSSDARNCDTGTTSASFDFQKAKPTAPIYRFHRGSTESDGSEILLEGTGQPEIQALESRRRGESRLLVEVDSDSDFARASGAYDDDDNARLVP